MAGFLIIFEYHLWRRLIPVSVGANLFIILSGKRLANIIKAD